MKPTITVIVITLDRPECVQRCLDCLAAQQPPADQVIVVDASADERTRNVVARFPAVVYLRNDTGFGRMTSSRNIALKIAEGEIIAFLDDDAFAHPGWLPNLVASYTEPTVGAVGGRALNNQPGEATHGVDRVGKLSPQGELHGYFAADPGTIIEVDHVMGCNMSFRSEVIAELGGFREDYPGISGVREDSDMCLRVKRLGYKILFNPAACVDHIGAPQSVGKRFDLRYFYYAERNHMVLLIRNFGPLSLVFWRYVASSSAASVLELLRRVAAAFARLGVMMAGCLTGLYSGLALYCRGGADPVRHDADAEAIRDALKARCEQARQGSETL